MYKLFEYFSSPEFLALNYFNNSIKQYILAFILLVVLLIIFKVFQKIILIKLNRLAEKTKTDIDDAFIKIIKSLKPPFYFFLAFWIALHLINIPEFVLKVINTLLIIWVFYQAFKAVDILIGYIASKKLKHKDSQKTVDLISKLAKGLLWIIGLLLILSNLGVNVNSLIAGLGIGGVAVALASQKILGDLFSSFAIYFDRPFQIGDLIEVDKIRGTVKKIGIKTTRLRAISGEEIILSNTKLTNARIHNFKKMKKRFVTFSLGIVYDTPQQKLESIPKWIKEIIIQYKGVEFIRANFKEFGEFALLFNIAYNVNSRDFQEYLNLHEEILFKIKKKLEKEKVVLAYPTQTIYLNKSLAK